MDFKVPTKQIFKIGEVCEMMQVEPYVLRYWETEFEELQPEKNPMGQRIYRPSDIEVIYLIKKLLYEEGYTIVGARKQLKRELTKIGEVEQLSTQELAEDIRKIRWELKEILTLLSRDVK